jgi:NTE family protein
MNINDQPPRKRVAIVIGSGGVKCAAALGLWDILQREGIPIDLTVGASGGSMYAAAIALGYDAETTSKLTVNLWTADLMEGYTTNLRAALSGEARFTERSGLINAEAVFERVHKAFGDVTFADTRTPLRIVSTDLYSGESVVHEQGRIVDAIRASIAIPLIFPPVADGDRWLVDGAVANPLPVDVAIKHGIDVIIAMGFELPMRKRMRSYTSVASHFNSLYMNNILKSSFAFYNLAHHAEVIAMLPEFEKSIGAFDTHLFAYAIECGAHAAEQQLPYLRRLLSTT